eukprot:COSAG03_NODE_26710_length_257_cov_0.981013_1_plen_44_part_10
MVRKLGVVHAVAHRRAVAYGRLECMLLALPAHCLAASREPLTAL